ncbi:hypothetical protein SBA4_1020027 [Candidatus Sulfopaludibacter sp. SbA4]|nr:hypothetical protein SBA4_1020027 [Candidatus Sulfopaludibacter sp. SbA4]
MEKFGAQLGEALEQHGFVAKLAASNRVRLIADPLHARMREGVQSERIQPLDVAVPPSRPNPPLAEEEPFGTRGVHTAFHDIRQDCDG